MKPEQFADEVAAVRSGASRAVGLVTTIVAVPALLQVDAVWPAFAVPFKERLAPHALFADIAQRLEALATRERFRPELGDVELCGRDGALPVRKLAARLRHFRKLRLIPATLQWSSTYRVAPIRIEIVKKAPA